MLVPPDFEQLLPVVNLAAASDPARRDKSPTVKLHRLACVPLHVILHFFLVRVHLEGWALLNYPIFVLLALVTLLILFVLVIPATLIIIFHAVDEQVMHDELVAAIVVGKHEDGQAGDSAGGEETTYVGKEIQGAIDTSKVDLFAKVHFESEGVMKVVRIGQLAIGQTGVEKAVVVLCHQSTDVE